MDHFQSGISTLKIFLADPARLSEFATLVEFEDGQREVISRNALMREVPHLKI